MRSRRAAHAATNAEGKEPEAGLLGKARMAELSDSARSRSERLRDALRYRA